MQILNEININLRTLDELYTSQNKGMVCVSIQ